ncbi:MAG: hypothetical protein M3Q31_20780 [Actinomycetota bacterium]|nr:hypothetical protein [Actinomycetota bacterium]
MRWRSLVLAGAALAVAQATAVAAPPAGSFSRSKPVNWVSVAAGQPVRVWVENVDGGWLSDDGGRTFRAPLSTGAFRRAQVAQATLLADGKTLLGMPTVWSISQFTPPRWSADGGVTWLPGVLRGKDAHYDFGRTLSFVGESAVTADPSDARTAWLCQGNLYVTHDAGRTWSVATPRFKRPWHCSALAIAPGSPHTLLLLAQWGGNARRAPGKILRSVNGGVTWRRVKAPHYPQLDYNGHALAFDPAKPSAALMIGANGSALGALYNSVDAGLHWKRVRPAGSLRGAVVDQIAFASDGRALAIVRIKGRQNLMFSSFDGGLHWSIAPHLTLDTKAPPVYASPLAASGTSFLLGTNKRGFWRLTADARQWARP